MTKFVIFAMTNFVRSFNLTVQFERYSFKLNYVNDLIVKAQVSSERRHPDGNECLPQTRKSLWKL